MPVCQNSPNVAYKGTEPSPKGKGFCARAEPIGAKMQGRDGRMWIVKATVKGVKRWTPLAHPPHHNHPKKGSKKVTRKKKKFVPHHERMLNAVVDMRPLSFRMVIGYFRHEAHMYFDSEATGDNRPFATKAVLTKFAKGKKMWDYLDADIDSVPVNSGGYAYHQRLKAIKPKNVKRVKVLSAPVHDPTFWEKLTGKHNGWWHKPNLVLVVDLVNVPVTRVDPQEAKKWMRQFQGMKNVDAGYWTDLADTIRHVQHSSDGWINHQLTFTKNHRLVEHKESEPFKGQFRLLQMGAIHETTPDYRKFE